jgi:hypothetical protein
MNSPFANLFLSLQERIQAEVPAISYIDHDLGQLSNKNRPPVSWPCVLIDFDNFRFKNLGENVQTAKGIVVFRLGFAPHTSSSAITPEAAKEQALGYYDIEWDLHKSLHGWSPGEEFGSLSRMSATIPQESGQGIRIRELHYKIAFDDYSTKPQRLFAPVELVVTPSISI